MDNYPDQGYTWVCGEALGLNAATENPNKNAKPRQKGPLMDGY
jgi:hypothetical protein